MLFCIVPYIFESSYITKSISVAYLFICTSPYAFAKS